MAHWKRHENDHKRHRTTKWCIVCSCSVSPSVRGGGGPFTCLCPGAPFSVHAWNTLFDWHSELQDFVRVSLNVCLRFKQKFPTEKRKQQMISSGQYVSDRCRYRVKLCRGIRERLWNTYFYIAQAETQQGRWEGIWGPTPTGWSSDRDAGDEGGQERPPGCVPSEGGFHTSSFNMSCSETCTELRSSSTAPHFTNQLKCVRDLVKKTLFTQITQQICVLQPSFHYLTRSEENIFLVLP